MFWQRKVQASAEELAGNLFSECVERPITALADEPNCQTLDAHLRLYQFAAVLLAVMSEERRDAAFTPVREGLERRFFTTNTDTELLCEVEEAMSGLALLLQSSGLAQPIAWAREWLDRAGIQEDNPAMLARVAYRWSSHYAGVAKKLRRFKPTEEMCVPVYSGPNAAPGDPMDWDGSPLPD